MEISVVTPQVIRETCQRIIREKEHSGNFTPGTKGRLIGMFNSALVELGLTDGQAEVGRRMVYLFLFGSDEDKHVNLSDWSSKKLTDIQWYAMTRWVYKDGMPRSSWKVECWLVYYRMAFLWFHEGNLGEAIKALSPKSEPPFIVLEKDGLAAEAIKIGYYVKHPISTEV